MGETGENIISLKNVALAFGAHKVHKDINLSVRPGEVVTILGPSGTGKTLLLKIIIGLLRPQSGKVEVCSNDLMDMDEFDLKKLRRHMGMLFQGAALFDSLSVAENIAYPLREHGGYSEKEIADIISEKLEIVNLSGYEHKYPPNLSGGQKKRIGLARALASSPEIMLFDEPTTGLDPTAIRLIDNLILRLRNDFNMTGLVVTHDIQSARRFSDRWVLIDNGYVLADGSVSELENSNKSVQNFISGNWRRTRESNE